MISTAIAISLGVYGLLSGGHALLNKRDPRSTIGWLTLCLMVPGVGASLYWVLGVNRIRTRARKWQERGRFDARRTAPRELATVELAAHHPEEAATLRALVETSSRVTGKPLLSGNSVEPLFNGEQAYPAMLEAIDSARTSVYLATYIFDTDEAGKKFIDALGRAAARGVRVNVLVDAVGARYSRPRAHKLLAKLPGVAVARFLPFSLSQRGLSMNLRNHRKLLIVDSALGFTGGMNIGQRHMVRDASNPKPAADLHFRLRGPIVHALQEVFFDDWYFATSEALEWLDTSAPENAGRALCRAIADGPNKDLDKLHWVYVGAIGAAHRRVQLMTPYFVPSRELIGALNGAALRGVQVEVILPIENNLPIVAWACAAMLPQVLEYGVRVFYQPAPFHHDKLLVVDEFYTLLGSANLDTRSLRLNFEFNLEVFYPELGAELSRVMDERRDGSTEVTLDELLGRSLPVRLRDGAAKLMAPYL